MKKILLTSAIAMLCFCISCKDSTTTSTTETSSNEKNLENNRKVMKAIETGDSATINSLIADDAVDHQGPNNQDVKGGDNVKHMLADLHNHLKDAKFEVIADASNGDYIFSLSRMTGTMADATWGMPAGTKVDEKGVDVVKVNKDGKMTEHWGFVDPAAMMKHMQEMQGGKMDNMNGGKMDKKMDSKMDSMHK
ncbi:MAG: nuclear transport factor 2 family protein [Bacteroidota bacterium]|nr:nuclear transport factor 2 family protein [Bacteroidota bacterium]